MQAVGKPAKIIDKNATFGKRMKQYYPLLLLAAPGMAYFILFCYVPMYGNVLAFKHLSLSKGILASPWAGFEYFVQLFTQPLFFQVMRNTVIISFSKLFFGFWPPIIFALLLNEVRSLKFKKVVQTVSYLPYFVSWIILAGMIQDFFSLNGPVNAIWGAVFGKKEIFLASTTYFVPILVITDIWKGFGWGSIIYFAAICSIEQELYEAAVIDGANRYHKAIYITLPSLIPTITVLLILSMSGILNAGFDQIFNLYNASVMSVADIIDTYVYRLGIEGRQYEFATAVGLFKSVIALIMIVATNKIAKKINDNDYTLW